ncbi:MAG: chromosomal replication initiator protein DnaA [Oligoflexales bacterium]|nr:chromosomal replication initiator protein DnaA [Oligoflexales bacterium]
MKTLFPPENPNPHHLEIPPSLLDTDSANSDEWKLIQLELESSLDEDTYSNWIRPIKCTPSGANEITLYTQDLVCYQGLRNEYLSKIEECKGRLGLEHLTIRVDLESSLVSGNKETSFQFADLQSSRDSANASPAAESHPEIEVNESSSGEAPPLFSSSLAKNARLNPNYTFDSFVRGPSNQFALASCLNVGDNPGVNYNPLFLYGSTGLGKTHLLHAVGNQVRKLFPDLVVTYISSERFMNEMIYCIRHNKMWDFRQKYRHCDLFMMDDIQFISGNKAATQEEFFHTFNTLYEAKKQIIITSDLFPQDIPDIEERLRNRFQWGLIADIQPPDVEHRIAILMNKAEKLKVHVSPEVAEYIATHAKRNVRELEGALHRIAAFAALQGRPLDKAIAMETFHSLLGQAPKQLEIETVQKAVADHFKLRVSDLKSKKRQRILTLPRQIAMYLARKHTQASYPDIGGKFGGKDHTTVMHAVKKISAEKNKDLDLKAHIEALDRMLEQSQ